MHCAGDRTPPMEPPSDRDKLCRRGGYSYTEADISFDPVLRIENAKMEMHTYAFKYIRTFELFQKSARIEFYSRHPRGALDRIGRWRSQVH